MSKRNHIYNQIIQFIRLYKENESLWNVFNPDYWRNDIKLKAYQSIGAEMGLTVEDVKKKIKTFRTTYNLEKIKVEESLKSGCNPEDVYKPGLFWYDEMSFLDGAIVRRIPAINTAKEEQAPAARKRGHRPAECDSDPVTDEDAEVDNYIHKRKYVRKRDEADIFAESWAVMFRKLPEDQQIFARRGIEELLWQGQLGNLDMHSTLIRTKENCTNFSEVLFVDKDTELKEPEGELAVDDEDLIYDEVSC